MVLILAACWTACDSEPNHAKLTLPDSQQTQSDGATSTTADPDATTATDTSDTSNDTDIFDTRRGEAWYRDYCASCHGGFGEGIVAPKLRGWSRGEAELTSTIDARMPQGNPSLCTGECAVEVARYILSWTGDGIDCVAQPSPLPQARLRLLNRREYNNTVRDLLGVSLDCDAQGCRGVVANTPDDGVMCHLHTFAFRPSTGQNPQAVHVAGSFNGWAATVAAGGWPMTLDTTSGEWLLEKDLEQGQHQYKYVLDAQTWVQDPNNPNTVSDGFGGFNSAIDITCDPPSGGECAPQSFTFSEGTLRPQTVHVAGNFNNWAATIGSGGWPMTRQADGRWTLSQALPSGTYQYKFVLDERDWYQDSANPQSAPDGLGGQNSVLNVACTSGATFWEDPTVNFPPENRPEGFGFDTNADAGLVTTAHVEAYMDAAAALSQLALATADQWLPCHSVGGSDCARTFAIEWGRRAFRRPLTDAEISRYAALVMAEPDFHAGLSVALQVMLSSPRFLYRSELGELQPDGTRTLTPFEIATALSYTFWASTPDDALLDAAAGDLNTPQGLETQARRLLAHPRSRDVLGDFAAQWLGVERVLTSDKNPTDFPDFDQAMRAAALDETRRFVAHVAFDSTGRYDELLAAPYTFANSTLAPLYGLSAAGAAHGPLPDPSGQRQGLLGHASVLASYAHSDQTSPIKRGLFVRQRLLCQDFPPPPANAGGVPEVDPNATTRERFRQHTDNPTCYACHQYIDGVGFGFEHFDPVGRWRDDEQGLPIDAKGDIKDVEGFGAGTAGSYDSLPALAAILTASDAAPACFVTQYHRFAVGSLELTADLCTLKSLQETFAASDRRITELMVALTKLPGFTRRK